MICFESTHELQPTFHQHTLRISRFKILLPNRALYILLSNNHQTTPNLFSNINEHVNQCDGAILQLCDSGTSITPRFRGTRPRARAVGCPLEAVVMFAKANSISFSSVKKHTILVRSDSVFRFKILNIFFQRFLIHESLSRDKFMFTK
jgi:hypothetical protein